MFKFSRPPITAVAQPIEEMGAKAVEVLLQKVEKGAIASGEDQIFLTTSLIVRQSCGSHT
jgi:DNA-binding LacI/PurR family transcriptional regulator